MNLPNLPTDNMYKFMALFGITLLISALFLAIWTLNDHNEKAIKVQRGLEYLRDKKNGLTEEQIKPERKILEFEADTLRKEFNAIYFLIFIASILGMYGIFFGFRLWYSKLQRFQDMLIEHKAKKVMGTKTGDHHKLE